MKTLKFLFVGLMALTLCGCGSSSDSDDSGEVQYFPVLDFTSNKWGIVASDGEMFIPAQFDNAPTMVRDGRFMVKNNNGQWEIYTADAEPQKVGGAYKQIGLFCDGVAPAVEKGKGIILVDRDGKQVANLEQIDSVAVDEVTQIRDGVAGFSANGKWGLINTQGKAIVPAKYDNLMKWGEGRVLVRNYNEDGSGSWTYHLLDYTDKEIMKYKSEELLINNWFDANGEALVVKGKGSNTVCGILNKDGKWVKEFPAGVKRVSNRRGDYITFKEDHKYGLMDIDGEVLLPAQYDMLEFVTDEVLSKKEKGEYKLIDTKGKELSEAYRDFYKCYDGKHVFARADMDGYIILGVDGAPVDKEQQFADVVTEPTENIESDKFDVATAVNKILTESGALVGVNGKMSPSDVYMALHPKDAIANLQANSRYINGKVKIGGELCEAQVSLKYSNGYYDRHPEELNACVKSLHLKIPASGKLEDCTKEIHDIISEKLRASCTKEYDGIVQRHFVFDDYDFIVFNVTDRYKDLFIDLIIK